MAVGVQDLDAVQIVDVRGVVPNVKTVGQREIVEAVSAVDRGQLSGQRAVRGRRLRMITMSKLAPFYFVKAGTFVSLAQAFTGIKTIISLFTIKVIAKFVGVWPTARAYRFTSTDSSDLTLMRAT